jgi:uncharacterized repeat protein (TIGR03803 family)
MTYTLQQSISKIRLPAASAVLAFVVVLGLGVVATQSAEGQTFTVLHNFAWTNGAHPFAGLIQGTAGTFYGTTWTGGFSGYGAIFGLSKGGKKVVLHSFTGYLGDGAYPLAGLVRDAAGNLYGTTSEGGEDPNGYCASQGLSGCGVVFKVDARGKETVLHRFNGTAGGYPAGGLVRDKAGNLYGTTKIGGSLNDGTVFMMSKTGKETVLHDFTGPDGAYPYLTSLLMDAKGNLYGVTGGGGTGYGTVYMLSKSGTLTVLHSFSAETTDGCYPSGPPAMDEHGNLYGTTLGCGSNNNGIVWKVGQNGTEAVLHNFAGGLLDGATPDSGVIVDTGADLYGDTQTGGGTGCGGTGCGTVFKLSKGTLTLLHTFTGPDGCCSSGSLIRDAKGNFYGATEAGGTHDYGTVWKLTP